MRTLVLNGWHRFAMTVTILLLCGGGVPCHAGPVKPWAMALGGQWRDEATAVHLTGDGGCILAGNSWSFDGESGYGDAWIVKLRGNGQPEWQTGYGDAFWDTLHSIRQTPDGGYIAAGFRYPPGGSQEAWVIRLAADGAVAWQRTYGRSDHYDGALQVRPTGDGGFIVAAWTQSYAISDRMHPWLLKLDDRGGIEWQQVFVGPHLDLLFDVEQTADGGYILAGGTYSYSSAPGLYSDVWVMKLQSDGRVDWQQSFGGSYEDVAYAIRQAGDGGYVIAAWSNSFDNGAGDIWVVKLNMAGSPVWQLSLGGDFGDVPMALWISADGAITVAGYTTSFGAGGTDGWLLTLNANGEPLWQRSYGGLSGDQFLALDGSAAGYVAAGSTRSFGNGADDVWVVRTGPDGGLPRSWLTAPSTALSRSTGGNFSYIQVLPGVTTVLPVFSTAQATPTSAKSVNLLRLTRLKPSR